MRFKAYQIYYDNSQIKYLLPGFEPYYNPPSNCTQYFENLIICELIPKIGSEYCGLFSWDFCITKDIYFGKRGMYDNDKIKSLFDNNVDVISFSYKRQVNLLDQANKWHHWQNMKPPRKRDNPTFFIDIFKELLAYLGVDDLPVIDKLVYENCHITKTHIYKKYISEFLNPAISIIGNNKELEKLFFYDAGYPKKLPAELSKKIGVNYYPFHPFVLERLYSVWLCLPEQNKLKFEYY